MSALIRLRDTFAEHVQPKQVFGSGCTTPTAIINPVLHHTQWNWDLVVIAIPALAARRSTRRRRKIRQMLSDDNTLLMFASVNSGYPHGCEDIAGIRLTKIASLSCSQNQYAMYRGHTPVKRSLQCPISLHIFST